MKPRHKIWQRQSTEIVVRRCGLGHLPRRDRLRLLMQLVAQRRADVRRQLEASR